jgi:hypothetical protein
VIYGFETWAITPDRYNFEAIKMDFEGEDHVIFS